MLSFPLRDGDKALAKTDRLARRCGQPGRHAHLVLGSSLDDFGVNVTIDGYRELGSGGTTRHGQTILPWYDYFNSH